MVTGWRIFIVAASFAGALSPAETVLAQQHRPIAFEFVIGQAGYVDEVWDNRLLLGGLIRFGLTSRLAVGPEFTFQRGQDDVNEWLALGTMTYDLVSNRDRVVMPFLIVSAGLARRTELVGRGPGTSGLQEFSSNELTASGGVGLRIALGRDWYVSGDARLGWEPERRFTLSLGWRP